ncbi:MAG: hypothetical protein QXD43_00285 [Candidatus Aenigmatarchaeota archaeon]
MKHPLSVLGTFLLAVAIIGAICVFTPEKQLSLKEQACISSGGVVKTMHCCKYVSDFPNTCLLGGCGCALENSHEVKYCDCGDPRKKCWDGNICVKR